MFVLKILTTKWSYKTSQTFCFKALKLPSPFFGKGSKKSRCWQGGLYWQASILWHDKMFNTKIHPLLSLILVFFSNPKRLSSSTTLLKSQNLISILKVLINSIYKRQQNSQKKTLKIWSKFMLGIFKGGARGFLGGKNQSWDSIVWRKFWSRNILTGKA